MTLHSSIWDRFVCVVCLCVASGASAGIIHHNGLEYATVDWISVDDTSEVASGMAGHIAVTFETMDIVDSTLGVYDFSTGEAFDELTYVDGLAQSMTIRGGVVGSSTLSFDSEVGSVLMFFGIPGVDTDETQFGAAAWNFDETVSLDVIDQETGGGFEIATGNWLLNPTWGPGSQASGVVAVNGGMTELEWEQSTNNAGDRMQIMFAVAVPSPSTLMLGAVGLGVLSKRRR